MNTFAVEVFDDTGAHCTFYTGKTSMAFHNANEFAKRITEALNDGTVIIASNNRQLLNYDNSTEILL